MRVTLEVPDDERWRKPAVHGEHFAYHGRSGVVLCGAGAGGAWVRFDGEPKNTYVGCPLSWLKIHEEAEQ